jgi:hypothetical protein
MGCWRQLPVYVTALLNPALSLQFEFTGRTELRAARASAALALGYDKRSTPIAIVPIARLTPHLLQAFLPIRDYLDRLAGFLSTQLHASARLSSP